MIIPDKPHVGNAMWHHGIRAATVADTKPTRHVSGLGQNLNKA